MGEGDARAHEQGGGATAAGRREPPRVWVLIGHKPGDNAQMRRLAEAVGWPAVEKKIAVRPEWETAKPKIRPALDHVDRARSDALEAPWPELVIASGRRLAAVALWIKQQASGRTRIVMVGLPRQRRADFDLLVVASQYVVAAAGNVAQHDLPLLAVDPVAVERAVERWRPRFAGLARPLIALLLGGPTGGLRFDVESVARLFEAARAQAVAAGGSLFVTTSRRTPAPVVEWLRGACKSGVVLHVFDAAAPADENPYHALLGSADHFVVTSDSLSMLVEVARLGRPLSIALLEGDPGPVERVLERIGWLSRPDPRRAALPAGGSLARLLARLGLPIHTRDLSAIPRRLVERGLAGWLGDPVSPPRAQAIDEVERLAERVRQLVPEAGRRV